MKNFFSSCWFYWCYLTSHSLAFLCHKNIQNFVSQLSLPRESISIQRVHTIVYKTFTFKSALIGSAREKDFNFMLIKLTNFTRLPFCHLHFIFIARLCKIFISVFFLATARNFAQLFCVAIFFFIIWRKKSVFIEISGWLVFFFLLVHLFSTTFSFILVVD